MSELGFHFGSPWWLLGLLAPLGTLIWLKRSQPRYDTQRYTAYADSHLLPLLLGLKPGRDRQRWRPFLVWSGLWSLLILALAAPRWDFTDMQLFRPGADLVVLFDLSRSMDATDVSPSRLIRARQELEDLINQNQQARIGLIAFATFPHVMSPLTEDTNSLRQQLPALSTDLVRLQGSRLPEALVRARQMLAGQPDDSSRHLLLISDGDFGEASDLAQVKQLREEGIRLHVLGVGTQEGANIPGPGGQPLRDRQGNIVLSPLNEKALRDLAREGGGLYRLADYRSEDTQAILQLISQHAQSEVLADQKTRVWKERFMLPLGLLMLLLLSRFRRTVHPQWEDQSP
jgi:Ca-activated chloride channel family protein